MKKIDPTDIKIMQMLVGDENRTPEDIAKELKIGSATVRRRINALTEAKIIRRLFYIDPRKIGGDVPVVIAVNAVLSKLEEIKDILSNMDENTWIAVCTGRYDLFGIFWFDSIHSLNTFLTKKLAKVDGIIHSETFICMDTQIYRFGTKVILNK